MPRRDQNAVTAGLTLPWSSDRSKATVGVRDSKDPVGDVLAFAPAAWSAFTAAVAGGRFRR
ncbi:hypothetical protein B0T36_22390 [Nocardia donostiensis]|uniref:DUF397 domain-containing protein n=1 Tax=Nocardia donostiensis TaxID=1538463 RepID=UPI0009D97D16|nr:DUF397 domain-containing protein [Nocardia donostiensis]OQS12856.1 hypothetical protein B0T36_22390 [Nocardia donostiensis]